jgi:hypothetical protein
MSLISDLRTYFDDRIKAVEPSYEFIDDPFGDDSISENYGDSKYKLYFGVFEREKGPDFYQDILPATLEIYSEECRDNTTAFDTIYDKAIKMADHITDPVCRNTIGGITDIELVTIEPSPIESNDNMVRLELSFNIRRDFKFC